MSDTDPVFAFICRFKEERLSAGTYAVTTAAEDAALSLDAVAEAFARFARDTFYFRVTLDPMAILEKGNLVLAHPDNRSAVEAILAPKWAELQAAGLEVRYHIYIPRERAFYIMDRSIFDVPDLFGVLDGGA